MTKDTKNMITFELENDDAELLARIAEIENKSIADLVTEMIEDAIDDSMKVHHED